ncbi:caspase family protein [Chroococcus sp. FPU101]|uniref:caspase family protein n=1 Tax=Chroococcus sp. FPU101 TaxID=1974212 RepID=UPI001A8C3376|nr:caspase family protein [Chroococcus sp. FPU101]GFE70030.1 peptidase C14 caspase catalytic subunit p20 [Chroococcus sp. FPU101]
MSTNRRSFLSQTAFGLLTLGVSPSELIRTTHSLAAVTPRKLALLVGINDYGEGNSHLQGCLTDVERQQELLVYRFGFNLSDIVTLTDQQATRDNIETAFREHLVTQAQSGDVVIFHFSGYGNQIKLTTDTGNIQEINSFLPCNGLLKEKTKNEIVEETIFLLARSLATDQVTMVLDTSHTTDGKPRQGNLKVRAAKQISSRSFPATSSKINSEELSLLTDLRNRTKAKRGATPATILAASGQNQMATEIIDNDWSAGLFTYALTQYLWQTTDTSQIFTIFNHTSQQVAQLTGLQQQPQLLKNPKSRLTYHLIPEQLDGAEGVITSVKSEKIVELSLTGLNANLVDELGISSCFVLASSPEEVLQIISRQGLTAKAQRLSLTSSLEVGQTVQEWIRVLSRQISLVIALDSSLSRIERVDATSALATIAIAHSLATKGEQKIDCILSKIDSKPSETVKDSDSVISPSTAADASLGMGSYRLLSVAGTPISSTVGQDNEAVKGAVQRLIPQFKTLLAAKLWRLTGNEGSSRLLVTANLDQLAPTPQHLLQKKTRLTSETKPKLFVTEPLAAVPKIAIGTEIQYRLTNDGQEPIYCLLIGIDASGNAFTLSLAHPETAQLQDQVIASRETLILPNQNLPTWRVVGPVGLTEIFVICSRYPFKKTLKVLETSQVFNHERNPIFTLAQPLEVAQSILEDLALSSAVKSELVNNSADYYALDVNAWVTLSFIYQVVGETR